MGDCVFDGLGLLDRTNPAFATSVIRSPLTVKTHFKVQASTFNIFVVFFNSSKPLNSTIPTSSRKYSEKITQLVSGVMAMFFFFGPRKNLKFFSQKKKKKKHHTHACLQFIFIFDIQRRFQIQQEHPLKHFFHGFTSEKKDKFGAQIYNLLIKQTKRQ